MVDQNCIWTSIRYLDFGGSNITGRPSWQDGGSGSKRAATGIGVMMK